MRVSTTTIEQFRLVQTTEWASEADLLARVRGELVPPTWQMRAGTAWHSVLDTPKRYQMESGDFWCDGHRFTFADVRTAAAWLGDGVWEVKTTRDLMIDGETVTLVGVADKILGSEIDDNKTKFSAPDMQWYEGSFQWRAYLWLFGASSFRYNVFQFQEPDNTGFMDLRGIESVRFYPYAGLESDVLGWVMDFVWWVRSLKVQAA